MARGYNLDGLVTVGAHKTAVHIIPSLSVRARIYEYIIGCHQLPAPHAAYWTLQRTSAPGTPGSAGVVGKFDPGEPDSLATTGITHSVEPTYVGGSLGSIGLNQQGTYNWKANPEMEAILAASTTAGGGIKTIVSTGGAVHVVSMMWKE